MLVSTTINKIRECGGCLCNISGFLEILPKTITSFDYEEKIPKYYILVDKVNYIEPSPEGILSSSVAIMFQSYNSYINNSFYKQYSYYSFKPSNIESLDKAVNWLKDYAIRYADNPIILNDFDEYHDYFSDPIEFPIRSLTRGIINSQQITAYKKHYNIQIHAKKVVMGDSFENINNTTIVNRSLVQNSFNKLKRDYDAEVSQALLQIADFIQKSNDPAAAALFDKFNEELNKPQPEKSILTKIWSGIETVLPSITSISDVASKIIPLFS